ncbi:tubulin glycylase 3A-like [Cylas formicarius]|uniref:tubulin glycylase 3A-like n=1 Tax=Cylas formicarius TaxID=197179 RepID=UPI002958447B|nr:tubulin glycylase 3A-like [Cylas formicarius]
MARSTSKPKDRRADGTGYDENDSRKTVAQAARDIVHLLRDIERGLRVRAEVQSPDTIIKKLEEECKKSRKPRVVDCDDQNGSIETVQDIRTKIKVRTPRSTTPRSLSRESYNPLGVLKDEVERAKSERKTFTVKGNFPAIRRALLTRGWVEKYHPSYRAAEATKYRHFDVNELVALLRDKEAADVCRKLIKSKLLRDHQVDLYWDAGFDAFKECSDSKKLTLINKIRRHPCSYTSKQGLWQIMRDAHWYHIPGAALVRHPRSYLLAKDGDTGGFVEDFHLTAAASLLKWAVLNSATKRCKLVSVSGKIPMETFEFAVTECYKRVKRFKHQDIDQEVAEAAEREWHDFLVHFSKVVHVGNHFRIPNGDVDADEIASDMVQKSTFLLNELRKYSQSLDADGLMNIWILKPVNGSRGVGIHMCRTLDSVLNVTKANPNRRYVVQKYIEKPLLVHNTKFDIRQWFLVSATAPLTIWMYRVCYLRFSSQTYDLRKLHESIHLTNNSVQVKYARGTHKDPILPSYNMWDSEKFKNYLSDIGYPTVFDLVIYEGMKQGVVAAVMASRDKLDKRKNCFELYGADFILTEDFRPWLLEINSNPALQASTPVTARLCPQVLEDVIKVVVDQATGTTGNFELVYVDKGDVVIAKGRLAGQLKVLGEPLGAEYFSGDLNIGHPTETTPDVDPFLAETGAKIGVVLNRLLAIVKAERLKRKRTKDKDAIKTQAAAI